MPSKKYTREDRYKAAASLIALANSIAASDETGIPASTIRHWAHNDSDFRMMCMEIRAEFGETLKNKLAHIVNEAADQTLDRLKNGDVVRDTKTGALVRVPIRGKDAAVTGAVAFDKLRLAESQPTTIIQHESSEEANRLLMENFRKIGVAYEKGDRVEYKRLTKGFGRHALPMATQEEDADDDL